MSTLCRLAAHVKYFSRCFCVSKDVYRTLLSDAYKCQDVWLNRLNTPVLSKVDFSDYIVQVYNKIEKEQGTTLDMDILANKLHEVHDSEVEMVENILAGYRQTELGNKIRRSIIHGIVRGYIDAQFTHRLLVLMKDKIKYGLHLDFICANILMDFFLKKEMYHEASQVAYDMMLQEDFSNKLTYLLSLYSTVKLLYNPVPIMDEVETTEAPTETSEEEDEEEEVWKAVGWINFPYYDDHFSINNERFLHGKTLCMLGKLHGGLEGRSVQLIGLGMYEKFPKAIKLLKDWIQEVDGSVVVEDAVTRFDDLLQNAPTRDPDEPEKDFGLLRIEDEINKLKLTPAEKEQCITDWMELKEKLQNENKISNENLETNITKYVKSEIPKYEQKDITELKSLIEKWEVRRQESLDKQIKDFMLQKKKEEIQERLIVLQEKEELLSYFSNRNEIKIAGMRAPIPHLEPKGKREDLDEDEIADIKRAKKKK